MLRNSMSGKAMETSNLQQTGSPKPGDYELGSLESRAAARALLDRTLADQQNRFRVNVSVMGKRFRLENTRCSRSLWQNGSIGEIVEFDGCDASLTEAESGRLEQLIRRVPIDGKRHTLSEFSNG